MSIVIVIESQEIKETQEFPSILKMLKGAKKTKGAKGVKGTMRNSEKLWEMMRKIVEQIWEKNCTKGLPQKFIFYLWLTCDIWRNVMIEVEFWHNL